MKRLKFAEAELNSIASETRILEARTQIILRAVDLKYKTSENVLVYIKIKKMDWSFQCYSYRRKNDDYS